jgi:hypothetical protein
MPLTLAAVMAGHAIAWRDEEHRVAPISLLTGATPSLKIAWGSDTVPTMGLFRRAPNNDAEIEQLRTEMASLREALEQHGSSTFKLEGQLRALGSPPPEPEVPPAVPAEPDPRLDELAAQLAALDDRVTAVATELANQLIELGHDIDALGARPSGDGDGAVVIGELRDGQVRLANEQARYQLAFREDLARLADSLKRPR